MRMGASVRMGTTEAAIMRTRERSIAAMTFGWVGASAETGVRAVCAMVVRNGHICIVLRRRTLVALVLFVFGASGDVDGEGGGCGMGGVVRESGGTIRMSVMVRVSVITLLAFLKVEGAVARMMRMVRVGTITRRRERPGGLGMIGSSRLDSTRRMNMSSVGVWLGVATAQEQDGTYASSRPGDNDHREGDQSKGGRK